MEQFKVEARNEECVAIFTPRSIDFLNTAVYCADYFLLKS